jgi:two-component system sensor histidine kinase PilS (NtrC family)
VVAARPDPGLHRKLVWITFYRVVMVAVLLGGTAVVGWREGAEVQRGLTPLFVLTGVVFAATIAFAAVLGRGRGDAWLAYAQIALDVGLAAAVVAMTGRAESVFLFMFTLAVVNGSILLFRRGALAAGLLSVVAYVLLNTPLLGAPPVESVKLFTHGAAFAATAVLASYLAEQLRATGQRLAERESDLSALAGLHEAVVQSMTGGLVTLDGEGRISFMNRAAEALLGIPRELALSRLASEVLPSFSDGGGRDEVDFTNVDGARLRLGYSAFPLQARDGRALGRAVIFQDLSRLRAMEEAVQRSERLTDLGRVAAGLAHEIRNPLASMSGSIELLKGCVAAGEDERRLMEIVLREAGRLNELVTQFLAFARPAPPRRAATDLSVLLDETLRVFRHDPQAAGVAVEPRLDPVVADCDPDQLRQVIWNLLSNAAQAVAAAGRPDGAGKLRISCQPVGEGAQIEIADDGIGMSPAELGRIFVPFFTTKPRGTGLGLATVYRIVEAHGGTIRVASEPGAGSRFTIVLPPARADG